MTGKSKKTPVNLPTRRCLVIQLARTSDTLQSLMALRAAKQLYPGLKITLVVRERFAAPARKVPWIEEVIAFPTEELLDPYLGGRKSESQSINELSRWAQPLLSEPWDFLFNWTFSEASSFLAALIPSKVKLGFSRREDLSQLAGDGWSHYVQAVIQGGIRQNIHITDILTTQLLTALQLHMGEPVDAGDLPVTSKGFFKIESNLAALGIQSKDFARKWVGIQIGAGIESRAWDPINWAEFALYVLDRHPDTQILLLGAPEEAERAKKFLEYIDGMVDPSRVTALVGKTDFDAWAAVLGRCQWLVCGDTAAMHLASILGTRVLSLAFGTERGLETGPYGNGHYIVTPANSESPDSVTSEALYAAWSYAANEWSHRRQLPIDQHFSKLGFSSELAQVQILRSRIRASDQGGGVVYEPMIARPTSMNEWLAQVVGHVARAWYCGWTPPVGQELDRTKISPHLVRCLRELGEAAEVLRKICVEAKNTAIQLHEKSARLKSEKLMPLQEREELRQMGRKLLELEALIERLSKAQMPLEWVSLMTKVLMHNLRGEQLQELGRETAESYAQLLHGVELLQEWIRYTLVLAKPVALHPAKVIPINRDLS